MESRRYLAIVVVASILAGGLASYFVVSSHQMTSSTMAAGGLVDAPTPKDIVTVIVHDKDGNLISKQETNNIITTAGAAFYCIQSGMCLGGAGGAILDPNLAFVNAAPTYWVQFVNGSGPNTNEPTASDCGLSSANLLAGDVAQAGTASGHCITSFGSTGQYPAGTSTTPASDFFVATVCVNAVSCVGDLRASAGTINTTAISTEATRVFSPCTPDSNGTSPASGTCENSVQTSTFTNNISQKLYISGLALYSGSSSAATAGSILTAEAQITPVSLNPGDTIQVTWQITI